MAKPKLVTRVMLTIFSPLMYGLTNTSYSNPEKKSYWQLLKEIWK